MIQFAKYVKDETPNYGPAGNRGRPGGLGLPELGGIRREVDNRLHSNVGDPLWELQILRVRFSSCHAFKFAHHAQNIALCATEPHVDHQTSLSQGTSHHSVEDLAETMATILDDVPPSKLNKNEDVDSSSQSEEEEPAPKKI